MSMLLVFLGLLAGVIGIVMIVINLVKRKPIRNYVISIVVGLVLIASGGSMMDDIEEAAKAKPETEVESKDEPEVETKAEDKKEKSVVEKEPKKKPVAKKEKPVVKKESKEEKPKEVTKDKGAIELDLSIPGRDFTVGKSDKNILDIMDPNPRKIRNDVTEKWRMTTHAESIDINEYLLSYNDLFMEPDSSAVHVIINFTYKTTTIVNDWGNYVSARIHEYVPKEEHDAKKIPSGMVLGEYNIYKDNGDIVDFEKEIEEEQKGN